MAAIEAARDRAAAEKFVALRLAGQVMLVR